jgi:YegS/Rv2252/BmrU family lipid kinase
VYASQPLPRQAVLVVNAHSRKGDDLFHEAEALLRAAGVELTGSHAVHDPEEMNDIVAAAVAAGAPMVIVGGGDGSLSSTVDLVVGHPCVFALLPLGTANSFARTLGIPLDLPGAVDAIANGVRRRIDLGQINGDYFANAAALGLSPMIGDTVPHKLKRYLGRVGYLIWAIWCFARFRSFRLTIDDGSGPKTMWATEVRIANGGFHGGVEVVEEAEVDSGVIVVQAVAGRGTWRLVWDWFAKFFKLPARDAVTCEFRGRRLSVVTDPPLRVSIDGEVLTQTPAIVEVARGAIEVAVPAEA